jgi:hypothetical protein
MTDEDEAEAKRKDSEWFLENWESLDFDVLYWFRGTSDTTSYRTVSEAVRAAREASD